MLRKQKEELVEQFSEALNDMSVIVVVQQSGMTVAEMTSLRAEMREAGAGFRVTKNRLAKIAVDGTQFESVKDLFQGPTAVAYSVDPVAAAKACVAYAKKNDKFSIVGGMIGSTTMDAAAVEQLSKLPSLDEFRAKIIGMVNAPATKLVGILPQPAMQLVTLAGAPQAKLARVFAAYGAT
ncbi:MAG: 50S ribosomal protein L10 [Alphaproteobacteria bacterium]